MACTSLLIKKNIKYTNTESKPFTIRNIALSNEQKASVMINIDGEQSVIANLIPKMKENAIVNKNIYGKKIEMFVCGNGEVDVLIQLDE